MSRAKFLFAGPVVVCSFVLACGAGSLKDGSQTDLATDNGGGLDLASDGGLLPGGPGGINDDLVNAPPTLSCADGKLDSDEACDDGNKENGDGCGSNCRYVEPGYVCPEAGKACRAYAKCGDGARIFPEQCDDGNLTAGDGCSATCKFEIGWTCDGSPSTCRATVCGDGKQEGAETCEEDNGQPFDGCSITCQAEPTCTDSGCTSSCGDGLVIGDEECDDGNATDGDGCSSACKAEAGYVCGQAPPCTGDDCTLTLPIVFRDFNESHSDFYPPYQSGDQDGFAPGIVEDRLNAQGKPVWTSSPPLSHIAGAESFSEWYTTGPNNAQIVGSITLYANGQGGYVNRFGANGERYITSVSTPNEQTAGTNPATCATNCEQRARDAQAPFTGQGHLRCNDICRTFQDQAQQLRDGPLNQARNQLTQAQNAQNPDATLIAQLEEQIATYEAQLEALQAQQATCLSDCQEELAARTAICTAQCAPCSFNAAQYCIGGEVRELDGNPLFFPIDNAPNALADTRRAAKVPAQIYGGLGWPWEPPANVSDQGVPGPNQPLHNFHFTSEIAYWFKYEAGMAAEFTFVGDDDVFVFVNRRLLIDLGGIHVPLAGQFSFAANGAVAYETWQPPDPGEGPQTDTPLASGSTTVAALGLEPGKVYEIKVFHAERKPEGSSFQLTLSGFNAARSECEAICGDGIVAGGEQCDDGEAGNTGGHNRCNSNCTIGAYCGDGIVQADVEQCDDADPNKPQNCAGCRILVVK